MADAFGGTGGSFRAASGDGWPPPPPDWERGPADVDVWLADVEEHARAIGRLEALLADAEWERVARYHHDRDRRRFIVVRGLLRALLGRYMGRAPRAIRLGYGPHGKPELLPGPGMSGPRDDLRLGPHANSRDDLRFDDLRFNVSHSRGRALFAFARGFEVGVDLEFRRPIADADTIASRFFAARERAELDSLPPEVRAEAFFTAWARKEAFIKGIGGGMLTMLRTFAVSLSPGTPPVVMDMPSDPGAVARWSLHDLPLIPGYAAALAAEKCYPELRCFVCRPAVLDEGEPGSNWRP